MKLTVPVDDGDPIEFECEDTFVSSWVSKPILEGRTYPVLPFVDDVRVVWDVGANVGAATVHFARHHRDATVHAFEPGSPQRAVLERNVSGHPNVRVHPVGLHSVDQQVPLHHGRDDSGMSSVVPGPWTGESSESVTLRSAAGWAREHDVDRIDVLKVDVEGCEQDVLESLEPLLPTVKVLYVEYDSRRARRSIEALVAPTHELLIGKMFLDQGECTYLSKDLAELDAATDWLRSIFTAGDR